MEWRVLLGGADNIYELEQKANNCLKAMKERVVDIRFNFSYVKTHYDRVIHDHKGHDYQYIIIYKPLPGDKDGEL